MLRDFWNWFTRETSDEIIAPVKIAIDKLHRSAANHHLLADAHAEAATMSSELASKARMEALKAKGLASKFTALFTV